MLLHYYALVMEIGQGDPDYDQDSILKKNSAFTAINVCSICYACWKYQTIALKPSLKNRPLYTTSVVSPYTLPYTHTPSHTNVA